MQLTALTTASISALALTTVVRQLLLNAMIATDNRNSIRQSVLRVQQPTPRLCLQREVESQMRLVRRLPLF